MYGSRINLNKNSSRTNRLAINPYEFGRELAQETGMFNHITDNNKFIASNKCVQFVPGVGNIPLQNQIDYQSQIDTETDLYNLNRLNSKCPSKQYSPQESTALNCDSCENCDQGLPCSCYHCKQQESVIPNCNKKIIPQWTKLDYRKSCNLPGIYINRFEPLCINPQNPNRIHNNTYIGKDTRNDIKDKFTNYCSK